MPADEDIPEVVESGEAESTTEPGSETTYVEHDEDVDQPQVADEGAGGDYDFDDSDDAVAGGDDQDPADPDGEDPPGPGETETYVPDPEHDHIVAQAKAMGMPDQVVGWFGSNKHGLREAVQARQQQLQQQHYQQQQQQQQQAYQQQQQFQINLNPEEFDEALIQNLQGLHSHTQGQLGTVNNQVQQMNSMLSTLIQRQRQNDAQAFVGRFDQFVDGLGDEYKSVIGQGQTKDLEPGGTEYKLRMQMISHLDALAAANPQQSEAELLTAAAHSVLGPYQAQIQRRGLAKEVSNRRQRSMTARPTQRKRNTTPTPEQEAAQFERDWSKKVGLRD